MLSTHERYAAWRTAAAAAMLVATVLACFHPMLGHGFYSDDFALIRSNRDLGLDGFFRFLLVADYGDRPWLYWRPGWALCFWVMHSIVGTTPGPWFAVALAMHTIAALVVFALGRAATGSTALALAAGLLFALSPAHVEGVAWVSAAYNGMPAAIAIFVAVWCAWRYASGGGTRHAVCCVLLVALSLLFKEAAYSFPIVFAAAWLLTRAPLRRLLPLLPMIGVVAFHFAVLARREGFAGDAATFVRFTIANVTEFARAIVPLPGNDFVLWAIASATAVGAFVGGRRLARYWLVWAVAALFPYATMTHGSRFAYFFHAPLALLVVQLAADVTASAPSLIGRRLAVAACFVLALANATRVRPALAEIERQGATCARVLASLRQRGLDRERELVVDNIPSALANGLDAMLELHCGHPVRVRCMYAVPRPPFLVHWGTDLELPLAHTPLLRWDEAAQDYRPSTVDEVVGKLRPVPMFSLAGDYRVVADDVAMLEALRSPDHDPAARPLLLQRPAIEPDPKATHRIIEIRTDPREMGADVECDGPALFVVAFPVPVDLGVKSGAMLVDGKPAAVQRANLLFHAVALPAGRHRVQLQLGAFAP